MTSMSLNGDPVGELLDEELFATEWSTLALV